MLKIVNFVIFFNDNFLLLKLIYNIVLVLSVQLQIYRNIKKNPCFFFLEVCWVSFWLIMAPFDPLEALL